MAGEMVQVGSLNPEHHIIAITMMGWGHTIAMLNLVSKIVRFKPVYITVGIVDHFRERTVAILDSLFTKGDAKDDALRALIRLSCFTWSNIIDFAEATEHYSNIFKASFEGSPIPIRAGSTDVLPVVPPAKLVISDSMYAIREIAGSSVKVYAMQSCVVAPTLLGGPVEEGKPGRGDFSKVVEAVMAEGLDFAELNAKIDKLYRELDGSVYHFAGLPLIYDHEFQTQKSVLPFSEALWAQWSHKFFMECDGVIHGTSPILEKDAIIEFERVFNVSPETSVSAGPFAFPLKPATWDVNIQSASDAQALLDRALREKGPQSVVYVSFGSAFWSAEPEKIWALIDILLEKKIYLLFSYASTFAVVSDDLKARLAASDTAFASSWMPQPQILQHEACGWYLTHCGENSYCESLSAGVPVICFPIDGDQPLNAIYATDVHCVGYELYNARNGVGLGPIYRKNGWVPEGTVEALKEEFEEVLKNAFGEDGKEKRKNVQKYQELLKNSWKEGGDSWKEIEKLFKCMTSLST